MTDKIKKHYVIQLKCIFEKLYVYFEYDKFSKDYCPDTQRGNDKVGYQSGNGIWIDLSYKNYEGIVVHEISHYLDWLFDSEFYKEYCGEIKARLHEYLYCEVMKIIKKRS